MFKNRTEAGKKLAMMLKNYTGQDVVVYALPRGGVLVGIEVAKTLGAPFDLISTRKIGHPYQKEYAVGAVAENGHSIFSKEAISGIDEKYLAEETETQKLEAKRRRELYVLGRKPLSCSGKTAIIVDDGIATGLTMKAAIKEIKLHNTPQKIIAALPVIPNDVANELEAEGVQVISVIRDQDFLGSVGAYYQDFPPVEDKDVTEIMETLK